MLKLDILFVHPNSAAEVYQELSRDHSAIETPIWAGLLAQHCRSKGFSVQILDCEAEKLSYSDAATIIKETAPRLVCFVVYGQQPSASSQNMEGAITLAKHVKVIDPTCKTIFVGGHIAALPLEVLAEDCVDFVCQNEGVYTIRDLLCCDNLEDHLLLEKVKGLGWKQEGHPRLNVINQVVPQELLERDLPGIAWDLLPPPSKYRTSGWHAWSNQTQKTPFASLYTSLGCIFSCRFCLEENTKIITSNCKNKKIKDITKEDKLLAFDTSTSEIIETNIKEIISRKVNDLLEITLSDGKKIKSTPEHPFFVDGKWVDAKELQIGDKCLVIDSSDKVSFFAKHYNCQKNSIIAKKTAATRKRNGYVPFMCTEEGKIKIAAAARARALSPDNPMFKEANKIKASMRMRGEKNPSWQGGISVMYQQYPVEFSASLKRKIKKRDNYTCQECGCYRKGERLDVHHIDYDKNNNSHCNLICLCISCHMKTNFNREKWAVHYKEKMLSHTNCPHYVTIATIKELNGDFTVYNFECNPYDNFFANYILTHNCMINIINRTDNSPGVASNKSVGFRYWPPEFIMKQFDTLAEMGVKNVKIADEMFVLKEQHFMEVCRLLAERKYDFNLWVYARCDVTKPHHLEALKKAGVNWLALGIESPNQAVRKDVVKGGYKEIRINDIVNDIRDNGIAVGGNFILGLPEDTHETMQYTLDFAMDLKPENFNIYSCMSYAGSPLYYEAQSKGWTLPDRYAGYSQHSYYTQNLPSNHLTAAEVLKFRDEAWKKYFTNPAYLNMMKDKFGQHACDDITNSTKITLKRRLLGD